MVRQGGRPRRWAVGITGASGAAYGISLCRELLRAGIDVHLVISEAGWRVLKEELGWDATKRSASVAGAFAGLEGGELVYYPPGDIGAAIASGSFRCEGMVVVPCSMGTLSAIAHGSSDNLLTRAADVAMKEGRPLLLVPRETPLNAVHLENMLKLARIGVRIIPAMPAFYQGPQSLDDVVRFMTGKIMDVMGLDHHLYSRWGESNES
ncbi:UbiX family flavin prenyltransferase [Cohnella sp. GCM10020058]|uniref:UbiX family flavin prenyltransferase n=1 Tax=Cohnella sp. GCM10020058 TaxID=3317330 RepID=UPI00363AF5E0